MEKKILLTTLPRKESAIQWVAPDFFIPKDSRYLPLGLLSLASNLPQNYDIKILDPYSRGWSIEKTVEEIELEKPEILGISAMALGAYPMVQLLNKTSAQYKIVGGPHTTHYAELILTQGADAIFRGPLADLEFARAVEEQPKGIINCKTNINQIKFPKRDFIDNEFYYAKGNLFETNKRMSMFSGVGCPNHCRFCDVQIKKVKRKTPELVLDEMIYLQSLGAKSIHVYEDNFNTDENYLKELCKEMDKRHFYSEWSGRGQARMSSEITQKLAERGLKRIHVGIESLSDKTLRWFKKPQDYNQIQKFCETMNKFSIDIIGFFIVGAHTETEEDRRTMASKIKELEIKYPLINILQPLPNTEYYRDLLKDGTYKKDFWGEFIKNPTPDFMLPFPYGKAKWQDDADFVEELINKIYHKDGN